MRCPRSKSIEAGIQMPTLRTYGELVRLPTFEDRFRYAVVHGKVGEVTFGGRRMLNQQFYRSSEWKRVRDTVIVRDDACDLAFSRRPIQGRIMIHHLNPISIDNVNQLEFLLNPEFLVCVSYETHNALHYGDLEAIPKDYTPRFQNDTCPWKL